jgi:alanine dehydrogenase
MSNMRVEVPKEIKSRTSTVSAMMPVGVELLTKSGHESVVSKPAAAPRSGFAPT